MACFCSFRSTMTEILDKTKEWSDRFGGLLRASAQTQYPHLYKGAVGGIEHVISVDNGGYYMELWRGGENKDNYYATTGAAIKPLPGLAKGARLDEALDRFFTLMATVEKDKAAMKRRLNMHDTPQSPHKEHMQGGKGVQYTRSDELFDAAYEIYDHGNYNPRQVARQMLEQIPDASEEEITQAIRSMLEGEDVQPPSGRIRRKAIPKKVKRLLGLKKRDVAEDGWLWKNGKQSDWYRTSLLNPGRVKPVKKRVMEKVDPEIGPSQSVGHRKPSDLSPESGVSKLASRMIRNLVGEPYNQMRKAGPGPYEDPHPRVPRPYGPDRPKPSKKPPVKKNVVALTAPGGVGNQPGSGRVKPGTPPKTYQSPEGFAGRRMGGPGSKSPAAGTSGAGVKQYQDSAKRKARKGETLGQKTSQRRAPYVGSRPAGASSPLLRRRKIDDITGGRVGEGGKITPVKPATGGPGQPTGYGSTGVPQYSYGRKAAKGCGCGPAAEVRKAVRAVAKAERR